MEKDLKICIAVRNKDVEDRVIEMIRSNHWKHSFVNVDDISCRNRNGALVFIIEDSYTSILDLIEMHNSCELNFLPVIILSSDRPSNVSWQTLVKYPEKYFRMNMRYIGDTMVQTIRIMDSFRNAYHVKKIHQFHEKISLSFWKRKDLSGFMNGVLPDLLDLLYTERGSIMLLNDKGDLVVEASTRKDLVGLEAKYKPDSVAWTVIDTQKPVFVENIDSDKRFKKGEGYSKDYFLSIPIFINGNISGVLNLTDKITSLLFDSTDYDNANDLLKIMEPFIYIDIMKRPVKKRKKTVS